MNYKNMINVILSIIVFIGLFLFLGNTEIISTKTCPTVKIIVHEWWKPVGIIIMVIGFFIYLIGSNKKSYNDGWNDAKNEIINGTERKN